MKDVRTLSSEKSDKPQAIGKPQTRAEVGIGDRLPEDRSLHGELKSQISIKKHNKNDG